jgi:hypothetical protein
MSDKNKHTGFKIVGSLIGIGIGTYVFNEVRKEYNATVEENNYLRNFIETHDFYEKENSYSSNSLMDQKTRMSLRNLTHVEDLGDGTLRVTKVDPRSGFSVVSIEKKDGKSDFTNNTKEA